MLCLAESYKELYCFSYKPNVDEEERLQEWDFLDLKADYSRMGLPNSLWKLSPVNCHYKVSEPTSKTSRTILSKYGQSQLLSLFVLFFSKVSDTYPAGLFVPDSATPPVIVGSSKFRSRGRFPTLSYYSKENHVS